MRFLDLGPLEVETPGGRVRPGGARPTALLGALLLNLDHRVSVDLLADAVWGDDVPSTAPANLENLVWRLRRIVDADRPRGRPAGVLINDSGGYRLVAAPDAVDSARLEQLSLDVVDLLVTEQPVRALRAAEQALALWRGEPYGDLADRMWASGPIARLHEVEVQLQERRVEALVAVGRPAEAVSDLEVLLAAHPFRERLWWLRMLGLHRCGRTEAALHAFTEARRTLLTDVGLEPGRDLRELQQRILRQDPALALAGPTPATERGRSVEVRLPRSRPLVGREADREAVLDILARAGLLTVVGPAGVGKTALAVEVARAAAAGHPDGVWFVDLSSGEDPAEVPQGGGPAPVSRVADVVAGVLGVSVPATGSSEDALAAYARDRRLLLVLDNCELVLEAVAELVEHLVGGDRQVAVLATSREPLGHEGEEVYALAPLPVRQPAEAADPAPALELFARRARIDRGDLTAAELDAVARICGALDGLPLAIELAAALVPTFSLAEIAVQVEQDPGGLAAVARGHAAHHQTVRSAIDRSYRLLSTDEQALHRRLSVLPGGYGVALAEAVGDAGTTATAVPALLARLVHRSLLTVTHADGGRARFSQLATVRAHAAQELGAAGQTEAAQRCRDRWVRALAGRRPRMGRPEEADWYAEVTAHLPSVRTTLLRCLTTSPDPAGPETTAQLFGYWYYQGMLEEGRRWTELALARPDVARDTDLANRLTLAGMFLLDGRTDRGRTEFGRAMAGLAPGPVATDLAELLLAVACLFSLAGDVAAARRALEVVGAGLVSTDDTVLVTGHEAVSCLVEASTAPLEVTRERAGASYEKALAADNLWAAWLSCSSVNTVALARRDPVEGLAWSRRLLGLQTRLGAQPVLQELETFADFLALDGQDQHAVRVFSATRARTRRDGGTWPRNAITEELLDAARQRLSTTAFDQEWSTGPTLSRWELVATA